MATAIPRDSLKNLRTLKLAHTAAVSAGDVIVSGGHVLIAVNDALADVENTYIFAGRVSIPKEATAVTFAAGAAVYWDVADDEANATSTDNTKAGIAVEAAAATDTHVEVMLAPN